MRFCGVLLQQSAASGLITQLIKSTFSSSIAVVMASSRKRRSVQAEESDGKKAKISQPPTKFDLQWQEVGTPLSKGIKPLFILDGAEAPHSAAVAGFDIDWTIIKTRSGKKFPKDSNDWEYLYSCVPAKLRELHEAGTKVVFFTNQGGIEKGHTDFKSLSKKIGDIIDGIGIPIQVFGSTGADHYRKPSTEMWRYMEENCNGGVVVDRSKSLYVGDAAGRPKDWKPKMPKDFSCGDRKFAVNVGVDFYTPEEFFLKEKPFTKFEWKTLDPKAFYETVKDEKPMEDLCSDSQEMVIMVGRPASGKSTLVKRHLVPKGYVQVNRDLLGNQERCMKMAATALKEGKSVVIDNTNPSKVGRKTYIQLAASHKVSVRCVYIYISSDLSHHLNFVRQNQTNGKVRRIPEVAYRTFEKHFEPPDISEGFAEVKRVGFVPQFDSDRDKEIFLQWTTAA